MADPLTEAQLAELGEALSASREELDGLLHSSEEDVQPVSLDEPIGRLTRMDALQQQNMAKANRRAVEARLRQVGVALAALQAGEYELCISCEEPIGYPRLRARPEARLCLPCQEDRESRR